jgi:hypothetical protein
MAKQPIKIVGWAQSKSGKPDITGIRIWGAKNEAKTKAWQHGNRVYDTNPSVYIDGIRANNTSAALCVRKDVLKAEAIRWLTEQGYSVTKPGGESGIHCPSCGSENIYVIQVECMEHKKPHRFGENEIRLTDTGFEWDVPWIHNDGSTENEIARCDDCEFTCEPGGLDKFGFGFGVED